MDGVRQTVKVPDLAEAYRIQTDPAEVMPWITLRGPTFILDKRVAFKLGAYHHDADATGVP